MLKLASSIILNFILTANDKGERERESGRRGERLASSANVQTSYKVQQDAGPSGVRDGVWWLLSWETVFEESKA